MSAQENKRFIEQYITDLSRNPKTSQLIDKYISDQDLELKEHIQVFEHSFPGYILEPKEIIADDDNKVSVSFLFKGTHRNEFNGIPATNKEVSIPGFISYHIEDRKIVSHDMVVDTLLLMQQLGVVPEMA